MLCVFHDDVHRIIQGDWVSLQVTSWRKAESLLIPLIRKEDGGHGDEAGGGGRRI
jgi:hypothetical protein